MVGRIYHPNGILKGAIPLITSKSISNRVLIIQALCKEKFHIKGLSQAKDTRVLASLLKERPVLWDVGPAGTSYRFLTAYLAFQPGEQILTGSERMKKRPIKPLVDTLTAIGARIEYMGEEGYPPLRIKTQGINRTNMVEVSAGTSSQFISALLLIAPSLPNGLVIRLRGDVVSPSYIEMTLGILRYFGVETNWNNESIVVKPAPYRGKAFQVEADWSAASYYYALVALADEASLVLEGLNNNSLQGDAVIADLMEPLGVQTEFSSGRVILQKQQRYQTEFKHEFLSCPDIVQTIAVICAGLGIPGTFSGVQTLSIKETNRLSALHNELKKVQCSFLPLNGEDPNIAGQIYGLTGAACWSKPPRFATYDDHRMAMSFAPLALKGDIEIESPVVVEKSYPSFWDHLESLGFGVEITGD